MNTSIERVGQGNIINVHDLLFNMLDLNWFDKNYIKATIKTGIRYQGWGQKNRNFFHSFHEGGVACHYIPKLLSEKVLSQIYFNVKEEKIVNLDQIDAQYIIDCRGRSLNKQEEYIPIINPLNSAILCEEKHKISGLNYTDCIATPHGWCFVIPNHNSTSYGYLFNKNLTNKEEAQADFCNRFKIKEEVSHITFANYIAKNVWHDSRTMLNGNRFCFIEPLEATSTTIYKKITETFIESLNKNLDHEIVNGRARNIVFECANFISRHYMFGSKFATDFWKFASNLKINFCQKYFDIASEFKAWDHLSLSNFQYLLDYERLDNYSYGVWEPPSIINWEENVGNFEFDKAKYI